MINKIKIQLIEFKVTNIPIIKPNKKSQMVCNLTSNTFSYTVVESEIVAPLPKPPLVVDMVQVNAVLTELTLSGNYHN